MIIKNLLHQLPLMLHQYTINSFVSMVKYKLYNEVLLNGSDKGHFLANIMSMHLHNINISIIVGIGYNSKY